MKIWIDGEIHSERDARLSVLDHGLLYGDGLFEGMRVTNGRVFSFERHLARLGGGLSYIGLELPGGLARVREAVTAAVAAHGEERAYVRLVITRGVGPLGVDPTTCARPTIIAIADRLTLYPADKLASGISLVTSSLRRPPLDVLDPRVKSLNYLNNAMAKLEARRRGADDALLLNERGCIAEAAVANVFVVRHGVLLTPPTSDGALEGITRGTVLRLARQLGVEAREVSLGRYELMSADEVFITGTGAGLVPVSSVDGCRIRLSRGEVFERVAAAYASAVEEDTLRAAGKA